ncbi:MAG: 4Fe-4S binding protein [Methylovirgula sp.]
MIRARYFDEAKLAAAPQGFLSALVNERGFPETRFTLQFYVEDCTGCGLCVEACPASSPREPDVKAINLVEKTADPRKSQYRYRLLRDLAGQ